LKSDIIDCPFLWIGYVLIIDSVLLEQAFFVVGADIFENFQMLIDKPLPATDKLRRLLKTKAPWDK